MNHQVIDVIQAVVMVAGLATGKVWTQRFITQKLLKKE
jgi:hypothetical protein